MCLSYNQIAGFVDYQYLWKESLDILDFLHGGNQGNVVFGCGQVCFLSNQTAVFFNKQFFLKKSVDKLAFYAWGLSSREGTTRTKTSGWMCSGCFSCPVRLQDSLINSITRKNQVIALIFYMETIINKRR